MPLRSNSKTSGHSIGRRPAYWNVFCLTVQKMNTHPETLDDKFGAGLCCVACGYDLRGIPEAQCPECGFGYDHTAIRTVATHALAQRSDDLRIAARWAWVATVLALGSLASRLTSNPFERFIAFEPLLLVGYAGWRFMEKPRWPSSWESLWVIPSLLMAHGCVLLLVAAPHLSAWAALTACAAGWLPIVVRAEAASAVAGRSADPRDAAILKRQTRNSCAMLVVGSFLTVAAAWAVL